MVFEWLKSESTDGGIGFERIESGREDLPLLVSISEEVADKIAEQFELEFDCSFDEGDWQYNMALEAMIKRAKESSMSVH